jgi:hypothetical protein
MNSEIESSDLDLKKGMKMSPLDPIQGLPVFFMAMALLFKYAWPFLIGMFIIGYFNFKVAQRQRRRRKEERQALLNLAASVKRMEENQRDARQPGPAARSR